MNTTCNEENHLEKKEQPWNTKAKIFMYKERQKKTQNHSLNRTKIKLTSIQYTEQSFMLTTRANPPVETSFI